MKNFKLKIIIIGGLIVAMVVAIFVYLSQKGGEATRLATTIASSVPTEGASGVSVFDPITITFNQPVEASNILITSEPQERWSVSQISPNAIRVGHDLYLKVSATYKLIIIESGSSIGTLTFETARDQNDPRLLQELKSELDKDYPLAKLTPYETSNYRIVYSAPLTLEISLKKSADEEDIISEVRSWVQSRGIDPGTHEYVVIAPTPTP